jgi:excinuclease ABC subunit C
MQLLKGNHMQLTINKINNKLDYEKIPLNPGVYIYKNTIGEIIYICKANNLRNRVKSYFTNTKEQSIKTQLLVSKINSADFIIVNNEVEALLLENNLIKKHSPKYNINLKDSKTYAYIKITNEKFPKIQSTRKVLNDGAKYFGPYTDGYTRKELVRLIVQMYKIRICEKLPKRACLQYHIGLCTAPCIGNINEQEYNENVKRAEILLKGDTTDAINHLQIEMKEFSKRLEYEKALSTKNVIESVNFLFTKQNVERQKKYDEDIIAMLKNDQKVIITMLSISKGTILGKKEYSFDFTENIFEEFLKIYYSSIDGYKIPVEIIVNLKFWTNDKEKENLELYLTNLKGSNVKILLPVRGDKLNLVKLAIANAQLNFQDNFALLDIKKELNLRETPVIIECFDISNLGREHIVAGMVRFTNGKADRKEYRKFLIRSVKDKNDDFQSMREVVYRRYKKLKDASSQMPDLIIVDGGPGQLESAMWALNKLNLNLQVIALAKQNEEIYLPHEKAPLRFNKTSKMMLLIRQIRDEVHRFTIGYNKKRREMKLKEEFKEIHK